MQAPTHRSPTTALCQQLSVWGKVAPPESSSLFRFVSDLAWRLEWQPPTRLLRFSPLLIKKARRPAAGIYAPRVRADPTATLACDAQHTPLDRRCSERTASGILPH